MFKEPHPSFPHTSLYAFRWTTPPPSELTYFMDDPKYFTIKKQLKLIRFSSQNLYMKFFFVGFLKKRPRCVFRSQTNMQDGAFSENS